MQIGPGAAFASKRIVLMLADEEDLVAEAAARALVRMGRHGVFAVCAALATRGSRSAPVKNKIFAGTEKVCRRALDVLRETADLRDRRVIEAIAVHLESAAPEPLREQAIGMLVVAGESAVSRLLWMTASENLFARRAAIDTLAEMGPAAACATERLVALLIDEDDYVAAGSALALSRIERRTAPALHAFVCSRAPRDTALRQARFVPKLVRLIEERASTWPVAFDALAKIAAGSPEVLVSLLRDSSKLRHCAMDALLMHSQRATHERSSALALLLVLADTPELAARLRCADAEAAESPIPKGDNCTAFGNNHQNTPLHSLFGCESHGEAFGASAVSERPVGEEIASMPMDLASFTENTMATVGRCSYRPWIAMNDG